MLRIPHLILALFLSFTVLHAQDKAITGHVYDAATKETLPFAIIKFANNGRGMVADADGQFLIPSYATTGTQVTVSYIGFEPVSFVMPQKDTDIYLQPVNSSLSEVIVRSPGDKIHRIIDHAIANKYLNDPDKYNWYQCHVYYKMVVNASLPDSTMKRLAATKKEINDFLENQHLLMSETYSIRTWRRPQQLQEDVLASRFSGLKRSMFTSLVTDVLPFHAYTDYINLNGKDYHNPISRGFERYYKFTLDNELTVAGDTVWALSFRPRSNTSDLTGTVYINSDGYAISQIVARATDTILRRTVRIEQQYEQIPVSGTEKKWFPSHLNYIIDWKWETRKKNFTFHMKGTSRIDSVTFSEKKGFKFDNTHTVRVAPHADELTDSAWDKITTQIPHDEKEKRTYQVIDSLGEKARLDTKMSYISKLPEGKLPIGIFDFDLLRLLSANYYENFRLGLGIQTNEQLIRWLSVGGWGGYGFGDARWKYGAFAEVYADRYKEFVFRAGYINDLSDPGRVHIDPDLDKNYLSSYLLQRVDQVKAFTVSVKKKFGYLSLDLSGTQEQILPKYPYALAYESAALTTFSAREVSLHFRYAYAERTAPFFGHYDRLGSRFPVWYGKITTGLLQSSGLHTPYTQALTAVLWHKHINRMGFEHVLLEGGKSWSNGNLPLSKLFAGNGFAYNDQSPIESVYTFGGMMTIYPYQYYSDEFINFIYRHDFDWKIYRLVIPGSDLSSAPNICLQYNLLYGTLQQPQLQQYVAFSVPDHAYNEMGMLLNNFIRFKYLNAYYLTFNIGYFYHLSGALDAGRNGRTVFSVGLEF